MFLPVVIMLITYLLFESFAAFAVMDFLKGRINDLSCPPPCLVEALNRSNLLKSDDVKDSTETMGIEELKKRVGVKQGPEPAERLVTLNLVRYLILSAWPI